MSDLERTWPRYPVGPPNIIHALGVVAAKYNNLEFTLLCMLLRYSGLPNETCQYLFHNSTNNLRLELLRRTAAEHEKGNILDHVLHFAACYDLCAENRNFLMHSMAARSAVDGDARLNFSKATKRNPAKVNALDLSLEEVRRVADDIATTEAYGTHVDLYIIYNQPEVRRQLPPEMDDFLRELPQKPSLPRKLLMPALPAG